MASHDPAPPELCDLLAAAKATPAEGAPRLVVADWLEEHGDDADRDMAALIRVQLRALDRFAASCPRPDAVRRLLVAAENVRGAPFLVYERSHEAPELAALTLQASQLAFGPGTQWLGLLGPVGPHEWPRGLAKVDLTPQRSGDLGTIDTLADAKLGHLLGAIRLRDWAGTEGRLAGCRLLARAAALDLFGVQTGGGTVGALLVSPHLAGLRRLDVGLRMMGNGGVTEVLRRASWAGLTELSLAHNLLSAEGIWALSRAPALAGLTSLNLSNNAIRYAGARALAKAPFLANLQVLNLAGAQLRPSGLEVLLSAPGYRGPAALDLSGCRLGAEGLELLLQAPGLEDLLVLSLGDNGLDRAAFERLADSPRLSNLLLLDVSNTGGLAAAEPLTRSPHLARLLSLRGGYDEWSRPGLTAAQQGVAFTLQGLLEYPRAF